MELIGDSDKWGKRGPMVLLGVVIGWALIVSESNATG